MAKVRKGHRCSLVLLLLCCGFLTACFSKTGNVTWRASDEVEVNLGKGQLPPGMHCYYSGSETLPHTFFTLSADVKFQQNLWQAASRCDQQVQEWLEYIDNRHRPITDTYTAGKLVGPQGRVLGFWYSKYHFLSGYLDNDGKLMIRRPFQRKHGSFFVSCD